jgi:hypothetical protein
MGCSLLEEKGTSLLIGAIGTSPPPLASSTEDYRWDDKARESVKEYNLLDLSF